jgi:hypothetical protein
MRAVPAVAGLSVKDATAALAARTFKVGRLVPVVAPNVPAGTVVGPTDVRVLQEGSTVDLQIATPTVPRSTFAFSVASAPRVRGTNHTLFGRILLTEPARVDVTLDARPYVRIQRWHLLHVNAGATIVKLTLRKPLHPGTYRLYWRATGDSTHTVQRRVTPLTIIPPHAAPHAAAPPEIVVLSDTGRTAQAISKPKKGRIRKLTPEQAYLFATYHDVSVIVLDADTYGVALIKNLRTVFPSTAVIAISKNPQTLATVARLGAIAVPANVPTSKLAALIARVLAKK